MEGWGEKGEKRRGCKGRKKERREWRQEREGKRKEESGGKRERGGVLSIPALLFLTSNPDQRHLVWTHYFEPYSPDGANRIRTGNITLERFSTAAVDPWTTQLSSSSASDLQMWATIRCSPVWAPTLFFLLLSAIWR